YGCTHALGGASAHVHAAIHRNRSPGNIGSTIRSQKGDDLSNLFRLTETTQRDLPQQRVTLSFRQLTRHVGINETRRHGIDRDTARAYFTSQRTTETLEPRLGCGVVYLPRIAHGTHYGTNADNPPPARLGHAAQNTLGKAVEAIQVGIDH